MLSLSMIIKAIVSPSNCESVYYIPYFTMLLRKNNEEFLQFFKTLYSLSMSLFFGYTIGLFQVNHNRFYITVFKNVQRSCIKWVRKCLEENSIQLINFLCLVYSAYILFGGFFFFWQLPVVASLDFSSCWNSLLLTLLYPISQNFQLFVDNLLLQDFMLFASNLSSFGVHQISSFKVQFVDLTLLCFSFLAITHSRIM